jgi:hypothetical protein
MGETNHLGPAVDETEIAAERDKIKQVQALLNAFDLLGGAFATLASTNELKSAEGRRCIVSISGLKHHQAAFFFEVSGTKILQVQPFEDFTTFISAPIDTVIRVLKNAFEGDENAFINEWARGQAKIVGKHSVHDALQFHEAFRRLARLIKRYRVLTTSGG